MKKSMVMLLVCLVTVLVQLADSTEVKATTVEKKKFFSAYAEECRADLNECLDHSWAHLPDSPPVGYCCEHYNYCLYGP